jgi:hypothetical protein
MRGIAFILFVLIIIHHCGVGFIHAEYYAHHHCLSASGCDSQKCVAEDDDCEIAKLFKHTKKVEISKDCKIVECDEPNLLHDFSKRSAQGFNSAQENDNHTTKLLFEYLSSEDPPPNCIDLATT